MRILTILCLSLITILSACSPRPTQMAEETNPAECLLGDWEMSNSDLNILFASAVPVPNMSLPTGTFRISFDTSRFVYSSDGYTLRMDISDGYMEAEANFEIEGTYTADAETLVVTDMIIIQEIVTWRSVISGVTTEISGGSAISVPRPGSGIYSCSATTLSISTDIPSSEPIALVFSRVR